MLDTLRNVVIGFLVAMVVGFAIIGIADTFGDGEATVRAAPVTSDNCEIFATVKGEDRYVCDDTNRGNVCYDRPNGMMFCLKDE